MLTVYFYDIILYSKYYSIKNKPSMFYFVNGLHCFSNNFADKRNNKIYLNAKLFI